MVGVTDATGALGAASTDSAAESDGDCPSPDVTALALEGLLTSHAIDVASAKPSTNETSGQMNLRNVAPACVGR
jgi:hypothetical protein